MKLDEVFREHVRLWPREAKSHFEVVDPGAWRTERVGVLQGLGDDWEGPFGFRLDGIDYEAYCLARRKVASQRQFLEDLGVSFERDVKTARSLCVGLLASGALVAAVIIAFVLCGQRRVCPGFTRQVDASAVDELYARAEARRIRDHRPRDTTDGTSRDVATGQDVEMQSLKERARAAFRAGRWAEAIPLVDRLTEETVDADLMYYIGIAYKEGFSVDHDFGEALYWFEKSAAGGHAGSQYEIGLANEKGNGIAKNEAEAARWYRMAAERGNAPANLSLGILYEEGRGVVPNASEAARFYRRGSELGNSHAGFLLGKLYEEGRGVPLSMSKAAECFRKAATEGHALAGYMLGKMYEEGRGVPRDSGEALYWYEKAGKLGNSSAMSAWQRLGGTDKRWLHPENQ